MVVRAAGGPAIAVGEENGGGGAAPGVMAVSLMTGLALNVKKTEAMASRIRQAAKDEDDVNNAFKERLYVMKTNSRVFRRKT